MYPRMDTDIYKSGSEVSGMKRVTFRVSYPDDLVHPLHRRIMDSDEVTCADLLMWGPMSTVSTLLWFDGPAAAVTEILSGVESRTAIDLVAGDDGTYAFLHQTEYEFATELLELIAASRVVFLPPVRFLDDARTEFEATGKASLLSEFYAELDDLLEVAIVRVGEFERWRSPTAATGRQRSALQAAVAVGYYDVPRSGSVEAVAERLDCAPSTAGELLRKGEASLIREFVDGR